VVLVPDCTDLLVKISTDLQEAVAHLRRVCDSVLDKCTVALHDTSVLRLELIDICIVMYSGDYIQLVTTQRSVQLGPNRLTVTIST